MLEKKLTVLFAPVDAFGHINACAGLGQALLSRGHRVVFAITKPFKDYIEKLGFEERFFEKKEKQDDEIDPQKVFEQLMKDMEEALKSPNYIETLKLWQSGGMMERLMKGYIKADPQYMDIIKEVKPDVIVVDNMYVAPSIVKSGVPYVNLFSAVPLFYLNDPRLPPAGCGLPTNDNTEWEKNRKEFLAFFDSTFEPWAKYLASRGVDCQRPKDMTVYSSPFGNFFMHPQELDYFEEIEMPENCFRFDTFIRYEPQKFEIPEKLKDSPGKLIFFSLGSIGSMSLPLMKRLIAILGKCPHRFVVSAGPSLSQLELPVNVWADKFLPQTAVIPKVDLVITHGGNNTVTETMYFGKPMIVLPLFGDQPDNAQRLFEKRLGLRFHAWRATEAELLAGIEKAFGDKHLLKRMTKVGERMRNSNSQLEAAKVIEDIVAKHKIHL